MMFAFASSPHPPIIFRRLHAESGAKGVTTKCKKDCVHSKPRTDGEYNCLLSAIHRMLTSTVTAVPLRTFDRHPMTKELSSTDAAARPATLVESNSEEHCDQDPRLDIGCSKMASYTLSPVATIAPQLQRSNSDTEPTVPEGSMKDAMVDARSLKRPCSASGVACKAQVLKRRRPELVDGVS